MGLLNRLLRAMGWRLVRFGPPRGRYGGGRPGPWRAAGAPLPSSRRPFRPMPLPAMPPSGVLSGKCHVIDGDTIVIQRTKIRLAGIDAPELDRPFGQKAKWAMVALCKGQVVTATLNGERSHDRLVGTCTLPDGRDVGAELIRQGLALDWPQFSGGRYRHLEPAGARQTLGRARGLG